jgi:glycosyltransferase involved in cell wall biosynthesis
MKVTVIIPCFNVQNCILECLNSVFEQTHKNIEVICIDNNSTDNTNELLQNAKKKYSTLIVEKELNIGAPAARNKGLANASGEWIQFLDADDLLLPGKIEHQVNLINQSKNVPFVAAASYHKDIFKKRKLKLPNVEIWKALFTTNLGITSSNLFRRSQVLDVGAWNETIKSSQEYDLMFRLIKVFGEPLIDNEPLTLIRERKIGQISQRNPKEKWNQYIQLRVGIIHYLKSDLAAYFTINKNWFYQELFIDIRFLYPFDPKAAKAYFDNHLPKNFKPLPSPANSSVYCLLFNFLGFEKTELFRYKLRIFKIFIKQ